MTEDEEKVAKSAVVEGVVFDLAQYIEEMNVPAGIDNAVPIALVTLAARLIGNNIKNEQFVNTLIHEFSGLLADEIVRTYRMKTTN